MKAPPEARFTDGACSLPLRPDEVKVGDCCGGQRGAELAVHRRGQEIFGLVSAAGGVGGGCGGPQGTVEFWCAPGSADGPHVAMCGTDPARDASGDGGGAQRMCPDLRWNIRAGEGNRTLMTSLEGFGYKAAELVPPRSGDMPPSP
jgi:hypothetical protein